MSPIMDNNISSTCCCINLHNRNDRPKEPLLQSPLLPIKFTRIKTSPSSPNQIGTQTASAVEMRP